MVKLSEKSKAVIATTEIYRDVIAKFLTEDVAKMQADTSYKAEFINGYFLAVQTVQEAIYRALAEVIVTQIPDKQVSEIYVSKAVAEIIQKAQWEYLLSKDVYDKIDIDKFLKQLNKKEGK